jgi:hypothetical protein
MRANRNTIAMPIATIKSLADGKARANAMAKTNAGPGKVV